MTKNRFISRTFLILTAIAIVFAIGYVSFFIYKTNHIGNKITFQKKNSILDTIKNISSADFSRLKGTDQDRINILLLGIAGKGKPGQNLTDTIMVASINPKNNRAALISLPRDLYVKNYDGSSMKINSSYQYFINTTGSDKESAEEVKKTVSEITGLDINYYVILNFDGFIKIIDILGGINIMNERDIYDAKYPGPNYSYEKFELTKGFHQLDGATALKYARERHDDPDGDFGRAKRQQEIMQATKNKIFSAGTMINVFAVNDIFNTLGDNVKTDIAPSDFECFYELAKKTDVNNMNTVVIDAWNKESLLKVSHLETNNGRAFILVPRVGNWSETQELAQNAFDLNLIKRRREEIAKEDAAIVIFNKSGKVGLENKIKKLLAENFNYKNVKTLKNFDRYIEQKTISYDLENKPIPFTMDELIGRLGATASNNMPPIYKNNIENVSADVVLILGSDIIEKYNMEEDSFEEYNKDEGTNEYTEFLNK
ncbi:MAG TPA: LCP family protein [Patescibacteria group bacterium]|nr:LCP family protein [Patescibacteria group bacterium]